MQYKSLITALVMAACLTSEVAANGFENREAKGGAAGGKGAAAAAAASKAQQQKGSAAGGAAQASASAATSAAAGGNAALTLDANAVQTGSAATGAGATGATAAQANSDVSNNNFINQCSGKTLTNGLQQVGGSCNGIVMGDIPAQANTPSTIITSPTNGQNVAAGADMTFIANIAGIQTGTFTNPDVTYYSAPQKLNAAGQIIGHTHFTVQQMSSAQPATALDPTKFAFFKGIDGPADAQGNVAATATGGLPAGTYRVCTMAGAANHQPVIVAAAQRGAQDDCVRFTVSAGGAAAGGQAAQAGAAAGASSAAAGGAAGGQAAQAAQASKAKGGKAAKGGKNRKRSRFGRHARALRAEA